MGRFRSFLACCRSLQVVLGCFLLVVGCFRSFLARSRSFQVVPCFSKYHSGTVLYTLVLFIHLCLTCEGEENLLVINGIYNILKAIHLLTLFSKFAICSSLIIAYKT